MASERTDVLELEVIKQKKLQNKVKRFVKKNDYNGLNVFIQSLTGPEEKGMAESYRSFYAELSSKGLLR